MITYLKHSSSIEVLLFKCHSIIVIFTILSKQKAYITIIPLFTSNYVTMILFTYFIGKNLHKIKT